MPAIAFSPPQYQHFTKPIIGTFWVSNPTYYFLEIGRNYVSIIITIISNISVCHGVNKKAPPVVSPTLLPYWVFIRLVSCFTRNTLSTFFCSDQIIAKKKKFIFKAKQIFSFNFLVDGFSFSAFCVCFLVGFTVLPSWN